MDTHNLGSKTRVVSIPTEIITDNILLKSPVKALVSFKCVSKYYNTFISSPEFIDQHFCHSRRYLILTGVDGCIHLVSIDLDSSNSSIVANKISLPHLGFHDLWSIVGSFNGLLCLRSVCGTRGNENSLAVINPFTMKYREIPNKNTLMLHCHDVALSFGFGFDDINHDYKLVRITEYETNFKPFTRHLCSREVMVFSLKDGSWKLVESVNGHPDKFNGCQNGVLMKNYLLHWPFWGSGRFRIYCFDVRSDKWVNNVPLMDLYDGKGEEKVVENLYIGLLDGCLCASVITKPSAVLWVMKEYGVKDSWVKMFQTSDIIARYGFNLYGPFGLRQGSKHEALIRRGEKEVFWCNIESGTYSRMEELKGIPSFQEACFLKESLFPIPGGQKIPTLVDQPELTQE